MEPEAFEHIDPAGSPEVGVADAVAGEADSADGVAAPVAALSVPVAALMLRSQHLARATFGFAALRPHQEEVLEHLFAGDDCLAVLPTGSGKSYCYGLPALARDGLVLVISPLIALMRDQARKFAESGVPSVHLDSLQSLSERRAAWESVERGEVKLLIVSPERLARVDFRERLAALPLQLVAIDEAHCISHWGSHFRPDYRLLGEHLASLGQVQKLAVTATATSRVREDICRSLGLAAPKTVWADFARDNLKMKVIKADKVHEQLTAILQAVLSCQGSGIVYTPTRRYARDVQRMLVDSGVSTEVYHAGMSAEGRSASQTAFMNGKVRVVVATHAFGLGIDKGDIRFVHHAGLPGSIEQYVQEIGRAGRDGKAAQCWLIYGPRDYYIQKFMIDKSYPDLSLLQTVLKGTQDFVAGSVGQSPQAIRRHLADLVAADDAELDQALNVLCREGLLVRLRLPGARSNHADEADTLIGEGRGVAAEAMFAEYPLRKLEMMAKLDAMRAYAQSAEDRSGFLDLYFRS